MSNLTKRSALASYLAEINRYPLLSREEEMRLALLYREKQDLAAAHTLVISNLRFVVKIALQYRSYGVKLKDLIQEGNIGLMMAVKRFDPRKGYRLISYAVWWIKAYIQKFILETYSLVKIGTTQVQRKLFGSLAKIRRMLSTIDGEEPQDSEIAAALDVKTKEVSDMKARITHKDRSLNAPLREDQETSHLELVPATGANQEELLLRVEEDDRVSRLMTPFINGLKEKEKTIVEKRLMSDEPATLEEIGQKYNISRERVRQIEDGVKRKIKGYLTEKGFSYSPA